MERVFCTVKGGFTNLDTLINKSVGVNRRVLKKPCDGCTVRSANYAKSTVGALSDEFLIDLIPTSDLNITVAPHEDNPSVPSDVAIGEPIILSCSYGFT